MKRYSVLMFFLLSTAFLLSCDKEVSKPDIGASVITKVEGPASGTV